MVTMSMIRKDVPKRKGIISKAKEYITPERKQKAVGVAKQIGRGAGVMGKGLISGLGNVGAKIQRSGMFSDFEKPSRSEYLQTTKSKKRRKTTKRATTPKSRLQELNDMGLI